MTHPDIDPAYMARALELAAHGRLHASPNPMVGAVIVAPSGRIIGEGWHRRCGTAHAEVNAVNSVAEDDRHLLRESTIYVTLEPCSHYGKTPPCSKLIIDTGIPRVVTAIVDPFAKVAGRGITMLREAGIEVITGVMEEEARRLNRKFFTAHTEHRPWVTLKWAQSADGMIDGRESPDDAPSTLSTPVTAALVHDLRATHDAILVGRNTFTADAPSLTVRHTAGDSPQRFVATRRASLTLPDGFTALDMNDGVDAALSRLYGMGITSLLVEGGARLLQAFIDAGAWHCLRVETNPRVHLRHKPVTVMAPMPPRAVIETSETIDGNIITTSLSPSLQ